MNAIKKLKEQWDGVTKIKVFEIPVIDTRTNEPDYIVFDISIEKNTMYAQHVGLTAKQEKSKKIAFLKSVLDPFFSLDEHLEDLHQKAIEAICNSDFYQLAD